MCRKQKMSNIESDDEIPATTVAVLVGQDDDKEEEAEEKEERVVDDENNINWTRRHRLQEKLVRELLNNLPASLAANKHVILWDWCIKSVLDVYLSDLNDESSLLMEDFSFYSIGLLEDLKDGVMQKYGWKFPQLPTSNSFVSTPTRRGNCPDANYEEVVAILQYCFLHIGDICRYNRSLTAAEENYLSAFRLQRVNGHPLNQLGLVATMRHHTVDAVYYYNRAYYCLSPFENAGINLHRLYANYKVKTDKRRDFTDAFLALQASLYISSDCNLDHGRAAEVAKSLPVHRLEEEQLLRMFIISLGTLKKINDDCNDVKRRLSVVNSFLQEFYLLIMEETKSLRFLNLIYVLCRWAQYDQPDFLHARHMLTQSKELITLLTESKGTNLIGRALGCRVPLEIDRTLDGFVPLQKSQATLDYSVATSRVEEGVLRTARFVEFEQYLCSIVENEERRDADVATVEPTVGEQRTLTLKGGRVNNTKRPPIAPFHAGISNAFNAKCTAINSDMLTKPQAKGIPVDHPKAPPPPDLDYKTLMSLFEKDDLKKTTDQRNGSLEHGCVEKDKAEPSSMFMGNMRDPRFSAWAPSQPNDKPTNCQSNTEWPKQTTVGARLLKAFYGNSSGRPLSRQENPTNTS